MRAALALCLAVSAAGCLGLPVPTAHVRKGPAFRPHVRRVLALATVCQADVATDCQRPTLGRDGQPLPAPVDESAATVTVATTPELRVRQVLRPPLRYQTVVDRIVRLELEFAGFLIADADAIRVTSGTRSETTVENTGGLGGGSLTIQREPGATLDDAAPEDRRPVLAALGLDAVLATALELGPRRHGFPRTLTITLSLTDARTDAAVWTSRCTVETARLPDMDVLLDRAARCALAGVAAVTEAPR